MTIYPSSRGDYYPKHWNKQDYNSQLNQLLTHSNEDYLAVYDHTFISVGLLQRIFQAVKGALGFCNATDSSKVNSELLKFFYYGEAQGWISEQNKQQLRGRMRYSPHLSHPYIQH